MYEQHCDYDSCFYPNLRTYSWCRACPGACQKHPTNSYKPPSKPQRKFDPDNGPWVGIWKKKEPLLIYEEALRILKREGYPPPSKDLDLIT